MTFVPICIPPRSFDDERWFEEIDNLVAAGSTSRAAITKIVNEKFNLISKRPKAQPQSVIERLYRKYHKNKASSEG